MQKGLFMELSKLLERIEYVATGDVAVEISGISRDNREAKAGDLFICIKGANFDGHNPKVVRDLIEKGVKAFIVERDILAEDDGLKSLVEAENVTLVKVGDTREAASYIYAAWYGHPADKLTIVGVTGSKGKTTTTNLVVNILRAAGHDVGFMGSNMFRYNEDIVEWTSNTTPDFDLLQEYMQYLVDRDCKILVMEVSSQATKLHRVDSLTFDYGLWLNMQEGDHIIPGLEHEDWDEYIDCKAAIIDKCKVAFINMDDEYTEDFISRIHVPFRKIGKGADVDYRISDIRKEYNEEKQYPGIAFHVDGQRTMDAWVMLPGEFNAYNALGAIALADQFGVSDEAIHKGLSDVKIKGRTEIIYRSPELSLSADYAHNQASAEAHLTALREFNPKRIVCIFGGDGKRDKARRAGLGEVAGRLADFTIVTTGHSRDETFDGIYQEIKAGLDSVPGAEYIAIEDRKEAIRYAIENAQEGDWIAMIGQGHQNWLDIGGVHIDHSDVEYSKEVLRELGILKE